ncbi:MAG: hypothetical protein NC313_01385 [Butyrivibrio sp.]|nr:hypothetical protein [Butyrivibrio sp.]
MANKLPKFSDRHKICIICEGNEEYEYLERLKSLKVWNEQYEDIKRKINEFHGVPNAADEVVIFGNPCTMQIIAKHWTDENLKSPAKSVNAPLIKKYTGVENYKGKAAQIKKIMECVTAENYVDMCRRVGDLNLDDSITGSSNFSKFIKLFESGDSGWIDKINTNVEFYE